MASAPPVKPWERNRAPGTSVSAPGVPKPWEQSGEAAATSAATTQALAARAAQAPSRPWERSGATLNGVTSTSYGTGTGLYNGGAYGTGSALGAGAYGAGGVYAQPNTYGGTYGAGGYGSGGMYGAGSAYGAGSMYGAGGAYGTGNAYGAGSMYGTGGVYGGGSAYGAGSMYGRGGMYGAGAYGRSMYGPGGGMYGAGMYGAGGGMYGAGGGMYGAGMYGMPPPFDANNPPPAPPSAWQAMLGAINGVVHFFGRLSFLVDENAHAVHFFISALLQLLDRAGSLYGELARFILRILLRRPPLADKHAAAAARMAAGKGMPMGMMMGPHHAQQMGMPLGGPADGLGMPLGMGGAGPAQGSMGAPPMLPSAGDWDNLWG